jgi:hypothetical protein
MRCVLPEADTSSSLSSDVLMDDSKASPNSLLPCKNRNQVVPVVHAPPSASDALCTRLNFDKAYSVPLPCNVKDDCKSSSGHLPGSAGHHKHCTSGAALTPRRSTYSKRWAGESQALR